MKERYQPWAHFHQNAPLSLDSLCHLKIFPDAYFNFFRETDGNLRCLLIKLEESFFSLSVGDSSSRSLNLHASSRGIAPRGSHWLFLLQWASTIPLEDFAAYDWISSWLRARYSKAAERLNGHKLLIYLSVFRVDYLLWLSITYLISEH